MINRVGSTDSTGAGSPTVYNGNVATSSGSIKSRKQRRIQQPTVSQFDLIRQQEQLQKAEQWRQWQELFEYVVFLLLGGLIWVVIAWKVLQWQKFPFHLYPVEVGFIFVGPIILLAGLLKLASWLSGSVINDTDSSKEKNL